MKVAQYVLEQLQQIMFTELHRQVCPISLDARLDIQWHNLIDDFYTPFFTIL